MPARKHDVSLKDQIKKPKYIDMVKSALYHLKSGDGVSKTKIMEYISDNYGLSKDVKTARSIEGVDRGGGGTGIEGAESGVEGAESEVEGAGSGSRGGGKRGNCEGGMERLEG